MASFKNVTIVGAAGNLGQAILTAILRAGFNVRVLTRAGSSSTFDGLPSANIIKGDYSPEFFRTALKDQDALILAVGSNALEAQKDIITAAAEVGVRRIIPSEFGSDLSNPVSMKALPFNNDKLVVAEHLEKVVASKPQTKWTSVACGPFFDWCIERNIFGFDVPKRQAILYDQGVVPFDVTNLESVGKAVAKILSEPDKYENQRIFISGMAISQVDIFNALKKATGAQDWNVKHESAESLREEGNAKLAKGDFSGIIGIIGASLFQDGNGSLFSGSQKLENQELGVKDDLDASVQKYVASLEK